MAGSLRQKEKVCVWKPSWGKGFPLHSPSRFARRTVVRTHVVVYSDGAQSPLYEASYTFTSLGQNMEMRKVQRWLTNRMRAVCNRVVCICMCTINYKCCFSLMFLSFLAKQPTQGLSNTSAKDKDSNCCLKKYLYYCAAGMADLC